MTPIEQILNPMHLRSIEEIDKYYNGANRVKYECKIPKLFS